MNHLEEAKDRMDILYSDISEKGVEVAKAHALIAIAEQLQIQNELSIRKMYVDQIINEDNWKEYLQHIYP